MSQNGKFIVKTYLGDDIEKIARIFELDKDDVDSYIFKDEINFEVDGLMHFGKAAISNDGKSIFVILHNTSAVNNSLSNIPDAAQTSIFMWNYVDDYYKNFNILNIDQEGFGHSMAISPDGKYLVVGAPLADDIRTNAGKVYIYERDENSLYQIYKPLQRMLI